MLDRLPDAAQFNLIEDASAFANPATLIGLLASAGVAEEDVLRRAFGVTGADDAATNARIFSPDRWPVGRLELVTGARIWIVLRNYPEDAGIDYYIDDDTLPAPLRLAAIEGCFVGPGFSWPEVWRASHAPAGADGLTSQPVRLLSLLPALGDSEMSEQGAQQISEALAVTGAPGLHLPHAAEFYGYAPTWRAGACSGNTGPRCLDAPHALLPKARRAVTQLLA
jgi:hypothetical protein